MDHFQYNDGRLCAEQVALERIAEAVGTPFYCYSTATIERHYGVFIGAFEGLSAMLCYSVKANSNLAVIRTLALLGAGADVVSGGELRRALAAGIPAKRIVFSGVGKTEAELAQALDAGVLQINVESEPEMAVLNRLAVERRVAAPIAVRVNPDVDAQTHRKITTGTIENKFGIEWTRAREVFAAAAVLPGLEVIGIAVHIGSQITDLAPFRDAYNRIRDLVAVLRADGHAIERLDLGGGLGIPYGENDADAAAPSPAAYGGLVKEVFGGLDCSLILEPGRVIVGNAGVLVSRVIYIKEGATRTFVILDAAMNDLMRPTLYDAHHAIVPVDQPAADAPLAPVDVVGPICETGDTFATQRPLPPLAAGDLVAIRTAGAYCATLASSYNTRPLVAEVLVKGEAFSVVRERLGVEAMLERESLPDWLAGDAPAG